MKNLSFKIDAINLLITQKNLKSVSFDIDGTVYPIKKVEWRWWKKFFTTPSNALKFIKIRKSWEKRRKGSDSIKIKNEEVIFFEDYLKSLLDPTLVPPEIRLWINQLNQNNIKIFFLSDHGAKAKLQALDLCSSGIAINCLIETGELKPHQKISTLLSQEYKISCDSHLHIGDRWTDEEQAKIFGSYFRYFKP